MKNTLKRYPPSSKSERCGWSAIARLPIANIPKRGASCAGMESQTAFETAAALLVQFRGQARMLELCEVDFDCGTHKRRYACGELPEELEL